jgi:hypothetical protein
MCMCSADMDVGQDDDVTSSQRKYRSSRTKLVLSSLRILGMDKDTAHWEEGRRRTVADALAIIHHHFKHVLCCTCIVEYYGETYLDGDRHPFSCRELHSLSFTL